VRRIRLAILSVLISACASAPTPRPAVKVYNLHQGLARLEANGQWRIYAEGNNFLHRVNGNCLVAGKTTPCMWFGVAFEFSAEAETTVLTCKATFSEPTDVVTPKEVVAVKTRHSTQTLELRGRTGKVFWQGYNIADGTPTNTTSVACEHEGEEVLHYAFTITE
jgi:hypothetical protein